MTVMIELKPPAAAPMEAEEIEIIPDLEVLSEEGRCSCAASDDNPY
ncbi:MAG: hypothetical protein ACRDRV_07335 [Pseudonocardiaceae bacterium]